MKQIIQTMLVLTLIAGFVFSGPRLISKSEIKMTKMKYSEPDYRRGNNDDRVDYPDYAHSVAKKVKINKNNRGILVCGSGMGMNIVANRHKNIRAAQCYNIKSTKLSRLHNDANIITLGSRLLSKKNALNCVSIFLKTRFEGGRHSKRIKKI